VERRALLRFLSSRPHSILLVSGPRNSGKTRLLSEVLYKDASRAGSPIHIDAREWPLASSDDLHAALTANAAHKAEEAQEALKGVLGNRVKDFMGLVVAKSLAIAKSTAKSTMPIKVDLDAAVGGEEGDREEGSGVRRAIARLQAMLEEEEAGGLAEYPVVWIDEVRD
jgi:AAA+ ATPase superfamily predicted ATPase